MILQSNLLLTELSIIYIESRMQNLPFFGGEWALQHNRPLLPLSNLSLFLFLLVFCTFFQVLQNNMIMEVLARLSESLEVDSSVVKVSGQSRDILFKKHHP